MQRVFLRTPQNTEQLKAEGTECESQLLSTTEETQVSLNSNVATASWDEFLMLPCNINTESPRHVFLNIQIPINKISCSCLQKNKQKNETQKSRSKISTETKPEMSQMSRRADRNSRVALINILKDLKENMLIGNE